MIVSDKLAAVTPGIIGPDGVPMRFVRDTHPLVGLMQQEVRQRLKSMPEFAGMTKDGDGSFTFRVWTADEVAKKLAKKDEQVHIFE